MSSSFTDELESAEWVEELQRKVFEECVAQSQKSIPPEDIIGECSTAPNDLLQDVPISVIISNIHQSFAQLPYFCKRTDFLNELSKSLQMVAHDKRKGVNWFEFKKSSERWFLDLLSILRQDGNNNIRSDHSDCPSEHLQEKEVLRGEEYSSDEPHLGSMNQLETMASCYSFDSSSFGLGTTDGTLESSEENDRLIENVSGIDLKVRFRRYNQEKASLTDELSRAEDTIITLEQNLKLTQKSLESMTDKCTRLRAEVDDHREFLTEAEQREESCKLELQKLEKSYIALQKKLEKLESEKENISNLKAKIAELKQENANLAKQLADCKLKYDEKSIECRYLQEENDELHIENIQKEKSYEANLVQHQEKIQELQNFITELQSQNLNKSDNSSCSQLSLTPPSYSQANVHSTPYNRTKRKDQDSLFAELRASGYNADESKIRELRQEISFYNEEIIAITEQVDEVLKEVAAWKNEICSPNIQLVESDMTQSLKRKITTLLNLVKTWMVENESPGSLIKPDYMEKPDVLPVTKKFSGLTDDQLFGPDKYQDSDWTDPVTSSKPLITISGVRFLDRSTSPLTDVTTLHAENVDKVDPEDQDEVIVPIVEALNRIIALKGTDEATQTDDRFHIPKSKSIFTPTRQSNWQNLVAEAAKFKESIVNPFATGDGPHVDRLKTSNDLDEMKTLKSDFKEYNPSPDDAVSKIDLKFVTTRKKPPSCAIHDGVDSTTDGKSETEKSYFPTPVHSPKAIPRRKLSVYNRSFDVDTLQTPDSAAQLTSIEKKRSSSTPDVQEADFTNFQSKSIGPFGSLAAKNELLTSYRSANASDSSDSPSPMKESLMLENDNTPTEMSVPLRKPLVLAPTKLKFPDSTMNRTVTLSSAKEQPETTFKDFSFTPLTENHASRQSKIISASVDLMKEDDKAKNFLFSNSTNPCKFGSSTFTIGPSGVKSNDFSVNANVSNDFGAISAGQKHKTFTVEDSKRNDEKVESTLASTKSSAADALSPSSDSSIPPSGASICSAARFGAPEQSAVVERAMSSGEDSSAESEPGKALVENKPQPGPLAATLDVQLALIPRPRSNSCTEVFGPQEAKVEELKDLNEDIKKTSSSKIIATVQELLKENENPKAFPSWTDERLQESGIGSFPDIDSEMSEILSEEELKKKYTAFSVGLATDRMTLSKRMILSRRHRDQAEKNFSNEVLKMQQDIKDLAPLCVDSESLERVERVRQQLDMISRCAHRISCGAETLGAVHQERRVSRAVMLADKYLQTLRSKCEKLASELSETKKILAENNIVLEDNLSEMGDDVPRVRYRAVPNNNRTMMARRRASIATITRPVLGSNQDISKEVPRQRNSVSGRVPGVRRPSLCYETPKWEIEKLDRADSNSITELREIFEQAESRRHSREENNNLIRSSVNNLALITTENIEDRDLWINTREDMFSEFTNDNELKPLELNQRFSYPFVDMLVDKYTMWKTMLFVAFIGFFMFLINHIVSSSERHGPPASWWSIEEIFSQWIQVETDESTIRRPV